MCDINWFSSVGLLLDIFGVVLLFKYGLPSETKEPEYFVLSTDNRSKETKDAAQK